MMCFQLTFLETLAARYPSVSLFTNTVKIRPDITNALIHLTGDRSSSAGGLTAEKALHSILSEGIIRGSGNEGFIKGTKQAVCFTEMPLSFVKYYIKEGYSKHKYDYFGIAMSKSSAWRAGARPVIYLPDDEAHWIPDDEKWRHVQFDYGNVDFTHEREWRLMGDLDLKHGEFGFYVIVPERDHEANILKMNLPIQNKIIGFLHMNYLNDLI
ncbi:hypothetical protein [Desulfobacula toluolica]|uniref:Conserved uncharacterized protein n=1 Tax=Desulfobacula toluolica (strain DSM 7467 / Tol2) TaxID=651182 RepID=K0NGU1_DESTT|nr:hypothetical protein [Desulfobacula toluolica]CCK80175.1 conserved uncharacterized protein [Desulfobacula toluolica Tol2]